MASEKYIIIPGTQQKVYDGTVVMLHRLPNLRWIIHNGYYTYNGRKQKGWYFSEIPSDTTMPVFNEDLVAMTVIDGPEPGPGPHPPIPPAPPGPFPPGPMPIPMPFMPEDKKQLDEAMLTVQDIEARDKLSSHKLPNGKIVRVNNSDGEGKLEYFSWNSETSEWELASLGYRYMTREEIETAMADDIVSIVWNNEEGCLVLGRAHKPEERIILTGVAHDVTYDPEKLELRIPQYDGEDTVLQIPRDKYMRSIRFVKEYEFPDGTIGPAIVVVVSDGTTEEEIAGDASGLIDIYVGGETLTAKIEITTEDNVVTADVKISASNSNRITVDEEGGLLVDLGDIEDRLAEVEEKTDFDVSSEGGILIAEDGKLVASDATIGGSELDPESSTNLAREEAVMKVVTWRSFD